MFTSARVLRCSHLLNAPALAHRAPAVHLPSSPAMRTPAVKQLLLLAKAVRMCASVVAAFTRQVTHLSH